MSKTLVVGYFGYCTNQLDGQTVKTRDVYRLVREQVEGEVDYYDTEDIKYRRLGIVKLLWKMICCRMLFYLPAQNNLKSFFPLVFCLSVVFRFKIHYFVVGGWLKEFLLEMPVHRFMLKRIAGIHVETQRLENELKQYYHLQNVDIFPNFRFFEFDPERFDSEKLRLVFMARVNKMKGLDWIFDLADYIAKNKLQDKFSITFFGPISEDDRIFFEENITKYPFVDYMGVLQPSEIYNTISQYDVMLLPTHYFTEGLPGSVVDAYISGIPVIVTEWKHSHEFVEDGRSGFIIPFENGQQKLIDKVILLERDRRLLHTMQANALIKRKEFQPPILDRIISFAGGNSLIICFLSRIEQSKGLDTLVEVSKCLCASGLSKMVKIDFYGQKKDDYFDIYLSDNPMFEYKGELQPSEVVLTLKQYDVLIFPSHYEGEGCPGILVEALSVGLPIIASDWKYNDEFIIDGVNGFLCDTFNAKSYLKAIEIILFDKHLRLQMSKHAYWTSEYYSVEYAKQRLQGYVGNSINLNK
jgi:glycosyltransferase involved in cell wall biosynthesis